MAFGLALGAATLTLSGNPAAADEAAGEVNVFSYRQPYLIAPLFDRFTDETGITVNVVYAKSGLIERIATLGRNSQADVLLTTDIGNLTQAVDAGIAEAFTSEPLEAEIPAQYRAEDGSWWGLTRRARVIYASKDRVDQDSFTYEELAEPKWQGKICIRSGQHPYNIALIASMIAHHGEEETEAWLTGLKNNLARKPAGNDRLQVKGVYTGECDIAIANTYYMGSMLTNEDEPEQKEWAESVRIVFPNTEGRGTHVNLSGAVLVKDAPHRENAVKLLEFLASDEGQEIYAEVNHEYPVKQGVAWSDLVQSWGDFKADPLSLNEIAALRKRASELVDKVGFDDGPSS
ncbi:Fe(3+) ABC transporter substrate-binding protein [Methyloligella sp. GL2]|uniref:Fe(3+) ABC transporter substrate-binding protein n=1 Tax=unclassified Methyloligella TaxID=2625955 RepID=UPI00352CFAF9